MWVCLLFVWGVTHWVYLELLVWARGGHWSTGNLIMVTSLQSIPSLPTATSYYLQLFKKMQGLLHPWWNGIGPCLGLVTTACSELGAMKILDILKVLGEVACLLVCLLLRVSCCIAHSVVEQLTGLPHPLGYWDCSLSQPARCSLVLSLSFVLTLLCTPFLPIFVGTQRP